MNEQSLLHEAIPSTLTPDIAPDMLLQAKGEFALLAEAKDILDEISMMFDVNKKQVAVLALFNQNSSKGKLLHRTFFLSEMPKLRARGMKDLLKRAESTHKAVFVLIELKQEQANLLQASSTKTLLGSTNSLLSSSNMLLTAHKNLLKSKNDILTSSQELLEAHKELSGSNNKVLREAEKSGETTMAVHAPIFTIRSPGPGPSTFGVCH